MEKETGGVGSSDEPNKKKDIGSCVVPCIVTVLQTFGLGGWGEAERGSTWIRPYYLEKEKGVVGEQALRILVIVMDLHAG